MPLNESEVHWQIVHGKPYEGKLHVRFGEGSPETGWQVTTALVTYSTNRRLLGIDAPAEEERFCCRTEQDHGGVRVLSTGSRERIS